MGIEHFWVFALTALLLNLTPGNDMIYVMARSTAQGTRAGVVSALGIMAGCLVHITAAAVGLSAIVASSAIAFTVIKFAGAGYLLFIGFQSLLAKQETLQPGRQTPPASLAKICWQGALTNALNPKVALFFLAFLPQFIPAHARHISLTIIFLGTWFAIGGTLVNLAVSLMFGKMGRWLGRSPRFVQWQKKITGGILIALGMRIAWSTKN